MKKIEVKASSKNYPVYLGSGIFKSLPKLMKSHTQIKNLFIVVDSNVNSLHREKIEKLLASGYKKIKLLEFTSNEKNKSISTVQNLYSKLINNKFGRDTIVIAIGGGITGDIVGFVASTFSRGVKFIQVPTTLLAAVDSSIGGKTGINFGNTKNLIGSFYQPDFVLIDTDFLNTLPEAEVVCGLGEILKYAYLGGEQFHSTVVNNLSNLIRLQPLQTFRIIESCIRFKAGTVEADEKESGLRKILNLGHTFAHALEVEQNHSIKHGQAVIVGIVCSLFLSNEMGLIAETYLDKYLELPLALREKIRIDKCNVVEIYKIMLRDKKGRGGKIKFVLLTQPGKILIDVEADEEKVIRAIENGVSLFV